MMSPGGDLTTRPRAEASDFPWATWRFARKTYFAGLPIRAHQGIAVLRGKVLGRVSTARDPIRENLESTLGGRMESSDLERLVRRTREFGPSSRLAGIMPRLRGFEDLHRWPIQGIEHLDAALGQGKGTILVTAHLGYYLLIVPVLRMHGYPVVQVMVEFVHHAEHERRTKWLGEGSRFRRWVYERTRVVAEFLGPDDVVAGLDVRPILEALSRNRPVFLAGDGQRAADFGWYPLLGRPYPLPRGFMKIAMATRCPVLPVFAIKGDRPHEIRIEILPPLAIAPEAGVEANLEVYARVLDDQLRRTPHLWSKWRQPALFEKAKVWSESNFEDRYQRVWNDSD